MQIYINNTKFILNKLGKQTYQLCTIQGMSVQLVINRCLARSYQNHLKSSGSYASFYEPYSVTMIGSQCESWFLDLDYSPFEVHLTTSKYGSYLESATHTLADAIRQFAYLTLIMIVSIHLKTFEALLNKFLLNFYIVQAL